MSNADKNASSVAFERSCLGAEYMVIKFKLEKCDQRYTFWVSSDGRRGGLRARVVSFYFCAVIAHTSKVATSAVVVYVYKAA